MNKKIIFKKILEIFLYLGATIIIYIHTVTDFGDNVTGDMSSQKGEEKKKLDMQ